MKLPNLFVLGGCLALLAAGCKSADQAKADSAVNRIANRPKPGYARVLNLTNSDLQVKVKGAIINEALPQKASFLKPAGVGKVKVEIVDKAGTALASSEVDMTSDMGTTLIYDGSDKILVLGSEPRYPSPNGNCRLVFMDKNGKEVTSGAEGTLTTPSGKQTFKAGQQPGALALGAYSSHVSEINVEEKYEYTFLFLQGKSGWEGYLMVNSPTEKPALGGMSAS